nr:hypothetical protein CFP56_69328 [Quercus suber]
MQGMPGALPPDNPPPEPPKYATSSGTSNEFRVREFARYFPMISADGADRNGPERNAEIADRRTRRLGTQLKRSWDRR